MNGGLRTALLVSSVTLAGCATTTHEVKVRPLDPGAAIRAGGDQMAVARGQLALGNVGLALEAFHIAQRARPYDPAPAAGIGDCYAAMGRYDIAESSYEVALSLAPRDHALLLGLASIVERAGDLRRASDLRAEADRFQRSAQLMAAQAAQPAPAAVDQHLPQAAMAGTITVELPPARPADTLTVAAVRVAVPTLAADEHLAAPTPASPSPEKPSAPPSRDMTVAIEAVAPRLERLSSGEMALVTTARAPWVPDAAAKAPATVAFRPLPKVADRSELATVLRELAKNRAQPAALREPVKASNRTQVASAVRWVPLIGSGGRASVQVLNAAGRQGVAASARKILSGRGWRAVAIGNASLYRHTSVVYYPRSRAALGRSLAAQFGVKARMIHTDRVVLLLGHDLAARIANQRRS